MLIGNSFAISSNASIYTIQTKDILIYNNVEYRIETSPLEDLFLRQPELRPKSEFTSTALWRGYLAKFEIINSKVFVIDIFIESFFDYKDNSKAPIIYLSVFNDVFNTCEPQFIENLTITQLLPKGKRVNYDRQLGDYIYPFYAAFEIKDGILCRFKIISRKKYLSAKSNYFKKFKTTERYEHLKKENKKLLEGNLYFKYSDSQFDSLTKTFIFNHVHYQFD